MSFELDCACNAALEEPTETNLVRLLDMWSFTWKHRGRTRAIAAYEKYCTLGLFGHGGIIGISKASLAQEACKAVNQFLKNRFPNGSWTSIAILYNPNVGLRRDIQNKPGLMNHAIAVGSFKGGRVWVEDEQGTSKAHLTTNNGFRELSGTWVDMHNAPVSFDARRFRQGRCGRLQRTHHKPSRDAHPRTDRS